MYTSRQNKDIPKTSFVWNADTEAERIFNTCISTASGFFNSKGFLVLPYLIKGDASCVYLPHIAYASIPNFWTRLTRLSDSKYICMPKAIGTKLKALLATLPTLAPKELSVKECEWKNVEGVFWNYVNELAIESTLSIRSLEVRITQYGTISSYLYEKTRENHLVCYLRYDMSVAHLAEIILTALLRPMQKSLHLPWETTEGMVDILLTKSPLAKYFTNYKPTLYATSHIQKRPEMVSKKYVAQLGLKLSKPFALKNNTVFYHTKPLSQSLTKSQELILKHCLQNENSIVEYDTLGTLLWDSDEQFSLWAINKQLQRLVDNLKSLGVSSDLFHIVRGRGFILTNM